jgi:hypothetical protein
MGDTEEICGWILNRMRMATDEGGKALHVFFRLLMPMGIDFTRRSQGNSIWRGTAERRIIEIPRRNE